MSPAARPDKEAAPRYLLVDGHSIIHSWPELRSLHTRQSAQARRELIRQMSDLHDSGRWRVTLVFDGRAGGKEETPKDSLAVLYASGDQTADSIIERIVQAHAGKGEIGVVTADHAEITAVESFGAIGFIPDWLRDENRVAGPVVADYQEKKPRKKKTRN
ncbi:MAG: NYN domain-containing protein, partial [Verrucomicrobiota bacterium]